MSNGFNFTYSDILALANTKAATLTTADLSTNTYYQEQKAKIAAENVAFNNMVATMRAANPNLSAADAKVLAERLGFKYTEISVFEAECLEQMQKVADEEAREEAYATAKRSCEEFIKIMGFQNQPQQSPIINLNAVIPQAQVEEDEELDEAHMTFSERCDYIECLVSGSAKGNTQFKKHLDTRHKNIEAKTLVKEWYKKGFITLSEKNSLLFMCNISTCSNHLNVTARR